VLLAALGLSIATQSLLLVLWGSQRRVFSPTILPAWLTVGTVPLLGAEGTPSRRSGLLSLGGDRLVPMHDVVIVAVFVVVCLALWAFFRYSRLADQIVASADARQAARACGIPVDRAIGSAFALGGGLAAVAGTLFVVRAKSFDPMTGVTPGILAFGACVLGGIGSMRGSVLGAFLISILASLAPAIPLDRWAAVYLPPGIIHWLPSLSLADWSYGVVYVLMVVTILFRPQGLFSR
jgi:branched-chain amino acid transport system permease protein